MIKVYSFLMYLLSPFLLLRLWWKGRRLPAYRQRIAERFCCDAMDVKPVDVWVHAVSLGEVIAATPLIDTLLAHKLSVLITTMTPTGALQVQKRFTDTVQHRYVPYDIKMVVRRFLAHVKPKVGVVMETELWPQLILQCSAHNIPLMVANGRLSERALKGYMRFVWLFSPIIKKLSTIMVQTQDDGQRYIALGAMQKQVEVLGNMKFDLQTNLVDEQKYLNIKNAWGGERPVLIIASTHHDEEAQILSHLKQLQAQIPDIIVLIAPRHPERFSEVYQLSKEQGINTGLRSNIESIGPHNEVVVLDSLGELLGFYSVSDFAFVGGSFIPIGGHNVLEPIAMNVPTFSGPHVHNFKAICDELLAKNALLMVPDAKALVDAVIGLYKNMDEKNAMATRATEVLQANKGSVERHFNRIMQFL